MITDLDHEVSKLFIREQLLSLLMVLLIEEQRFSPLSGFKTSGRSKI